MNLYEITKEEAYHVFRTGGTVYGSSVGSGQRRVFLNAKDANAPLLWVLEHTRLQNEGIAQPFQYWTD